MTGGTLYDEPRDALVMLERAVVGIEGALLPERAGAANKGRIAA